MGRTRRRGRRPPRLVRPDPRPPRGSELSDEGIDMTAAVNVFSWGALCARALRKVAPLDHTGRSVSLLRVRHTGEATGAMEEIRLEE
ncbi:DUF6333 family protein [Streptomyces caniferus]|uniref:DUF6333 family protein n=1 Tax=Streptomyces caniferus TaxID=285557 RepID=UPI0034549EBE